MKTKTFLLVILLPFFCYSQNWEVVDFPEMPQKVSLESVFFLNNNHGWIAGYTYEEEAGLLKAASRRGLLLVYKDGTWTRMELPEYDYDWTLRKVCFVNESNGYAIGLDGEKDQGLVLNFSDGRWSRLDLPEIPFKSFRLYGIDLWDSDKGWIVGGGEGDGPVILKIEGDRLEIVEEKEFFKKQTLVTIHAFSNERFFTAGFNEGRMSGSMQTNKAWGSFAADYHNNSWEKVKLPLLFGNVIWMDCAFVSEMKGWMCGWMPEFNNAPSVGKIAHYNGKKWVSEKVPDVAKEWTLSGIDFLDEKKGYAVGNYPNRDHAVILVYQKGEWSALKKKEMPVLEGRWKLNDVAWNKKDTWWAVGKNTKNQGLILRKSN